MATNQHACAKTSRSTFTAKLDLLCRRHKWQCFFDEKKRPRKGTEQGEEKEAGSEGSDADAEDEGDASGGEEEDEDEEYKPSQREIKNRKRRWRKEEDSAVLWNIVKCVIKDYNEMANESCTNIIICVHIIGTGSYGKAFSASTGSKAEA